jgi:hypothetical protein
MKSFWKSLIALVLLSTAIAVGYFATQDNQDTRNKAASTGSDLSMQTANTTQPNGNTFSVGILLSTGPDSVSATQLAIGFDPNLLEVTAFTPSPNTPLPVVLSNFSSSNGVATITLGAQPAAPFQGSAVIGTLTVVSKTNASTSLGFTDNTVVTAIGKTTNALIAKTGLTINAGITTPTPTPPPTQTITSTPTPTPTQGTQSQTMTLRMKLAGVTGEQANGAKVGVKFVQQNGNIMQLSSPLTLTHVGSGVYQAQAVITNPFVAGTKFRVKLKGEKHVAIEFCRQSGQTSPCSDSEFITMSTPTPSTFTMDFTGIPLPPGDLLVQDGKADMNDMNKLKPLMSKLCSSLTTEEKMTGDVNYNGCVTVQDVFLVLQTLETRYDE